MKDQIVTVICVKCGGERNHTILSFASTVENEEDEAEHEYFHSETIHQIVKCAGCNSITFREVSTNSEEYDREGHLAETISLYPARVLPIIKVRWYRSVPYQIKNIYSETVQAYNNRLYVLCAAGIRAIIEGICTDKEMKSKIKEKGELEGLKKPLKNNLEAQIDSLADHGWLTIPHASILHEHRFLGNDALHDLESPTLSELQIAIEIIEETLSVVYEIGDKREHMKRNRENRKT